MGAEKRRCTCAAGNAIPRQASRHSYTDQRKHPGQFQHAPAHNVMRVSTERTDRPTVRRKPRAERAAFPSTCLVLIDHNNITRGDMFCFETNAKKKKKKKVKFPPPFFVYNPQGCWSKCACACVRGRRTCTHAHAHAPRLPLRWGPELSGRRLRPRQGVLFALCGGCDGGWPVRPLWRWRLSRMFSTNRPTSRCVCGFVWTCSSCRSPPSSSSMLQ